MAIKESVWEDVCSRDVQNRSAEEEEKRKKHKKERKKEGKTRPHQTRPDRKATGAASRHRSESPATLSVKKAPPDKSQPVNGNLRVIAKFFSR